MGGPRRGARIGGSLPENVELYETLGLRPGATIEEIRKAYKQASLRYHPDKLLPRGRTPTPDEVQEIQDLFQRASEASECR